MAKPEAKKVPFSGFARTVECVKQGLYNNFSIVTLEIKDGVVVNKWATQPYASWECISKLEIESMNATLNLNFNYADGSAWRK